MSRTITLGTLKRRAREMADQEIGAGAGSAAFVDDTELLGMIQGSIALWHGKLVAAVPERYEASSTVTATGASSYALPADYYATLGVWYSNNGTWVDMPRVQFRERVRYDTSSNAQAEGYYLAGAKLYFLPNPSSGTYKHIYATHAPDVTSQSTGFTIEGVNGWEEWIVYDVAIKMLLKEESTETASALMQERARIEMAIDMAAADRDLVNPQHVVDTRGILAYDPDFWSWR